MMIKIIIVDDHPVICFGLISLLKTQPDMQFVGQAEDEKTAIELLCSLKPDLVILDLMLNGLSGLNLLDYIQDHHLSSKVLIYSSFSNDNLIFQTLQKGATGYLLKDSSTAQILQAIRHVAIGKPFLSSSIESKIINNLSKRTTQDNDYHQLSNREREVFMLAAKGFEDTEIATQLFISLATVRSHISKILQKLNLRNRTQLLIYALNYNLISWEDIQHNPFNFC